MTLAILEKAMWDLGTARENLEQFSTQPDTYLEKYTLTEEEKHLLKSMDVRTLTDLGCDPMLAMNTWNAVMGGDQTPEYIRRMNTASEKN